MVERSHTAGWPAQIDAPQRQMNDKTTYWFAAKADGAMTEDYYGISVELPGVAVGDLQIIAQDGTLPVRGEKRFDHTESGRTYFFSEPEYGAFQPSFRCHLCRSRSDRCRVQVEIAIPKLQPAAGTAAGSPFVLIEARGPATVRH
jgi:HSP20 family protein